MGHLHCPNLWFLLLYHGEVKEIEGNKELGGMSLSDENRNICLNLEGLQVNHVTYFLFWKGKGGGRVCETLSK